MRVIITCGGTGGHIYPGIAIADKIKKENPDAEILFIGTKNGMENNLVPNAGYEIRGVDSKGFDRKHILENFKTIHYTLKGSAEVAKILEEFKPDFAIGTGGYVTGPTLLQAHRHHVKCYIHESNAMPGLANRIISEFADKVFTSFEGSEQYFRRSDRVVHTGNPIRAEFDSLNRDECRKELGLKDNDQMVLIFGGSLGAAVINENAIRLIQKIREQKCDIKLIFVTGNRYYDSIKAKLDEQGGLPENVTLMAYAHDMPHIMCAADIVVSRSGAIAVSEIAVSGKPSILIPSPNVTANHQYYNAKALADKGAAILIEEKDMREGKVDFCETVLSLAAQPETLSSMSFAAKSMANTEAIDIIYKNLNI